MSDELVLLAQQSELHDISFSDYLKRGADVSPTSARKAVEVARHFGPDIAAAYVLEKLSRSLRYLELTGQDEKPGDLIAAELRNRGEDGRFVAVPFHRASVSQIDEAIQIELRRQRAGPSRPPEGLGDLVERIGAVLPAVPRGMRAAKTQVETSKSKRGEVVFTFKQIPLSELRAFLAAVEKELGEEGE